MRLNKIITSALAGIMMLSLAACGNKSAATSKKDAVESSSHVTKKRDSKKQSIKVAKSSSVSSDSDLTDKVSSSKTSSGSNTTIKGVQNSSTAKSVSQSQTRTMTEVDARNLVKEHLGNQRANALEAGRGEPTQPAVSSIDNFVARQNGTNDWTISGTYGGRTYTYHVTPSAVTGA